MGEVVQLKQTEELKKIYVSALIQKLCIFHEGPDIALQVLVSQTLVCLPLLVNCCITLQSLK